MGTGKELGCCTYGHRRNTVDRTFRRGAGRGGFPQQRKYVQAREGTTEGVIAEKGHFPFLGGTVWLSPGLWAPV